MEYDLTNEVKVIGSLNFEGNIVPLEWFKRIKLDNNKPDLISIFILSDIIYWYRPTTIRDEQSGRIIGYRKKFKSDLLQKSYKDLEEMFGLSRDQIKDSLQRLEKLKLIKRVFRNINSQGTCLTNVMFIQIFPNKIAEISEKKADAGINPHTYGEISSEVRGNILTPIGIYPHTYTKTTTETTTNNTLSPKLKKKTTSSNNHQEEIGERENEMLKIWNEVIEKHFGREIKITSKRKTALQHRLKEFFNNDISLWKEFCQNILTSKFLMGEIKDFRVSLDWILNEDNMIKVIEGNYHRGGDSKALNDSDPKSQEQVMLAEIQESNTPNFWKEIMKTLLEEKGMAVFSSWFKKIEFILYESGVLQIKAFSRFVEAWVTEKYHDDMVKICKAEIQDFKELKIYS